MKRSTCSIRDLAEYVNVSPSTVSRVLNNKKSNVKQEYLGRWIKFS